MLNHLEKARRHMLRIQFGLIAVLSLVLITGLVNEAQSKVMASPQANGTLMMGNPDLGMKCIFLVSSTEAADRTNLLLSGLLSFDAFMDSIREQYGKTPEGFKAWEGNMRAYWNENCVPETVGDGV